MKKNVPNILPVSIKYDIEVFMNLHVITVQRDINNGYFVSNEDLELVSAIGQIYNWYDRVDMKFHNFSTSSEICRKKVRFHKLNLLRAINQLLVPEEILELKEIEMSMKIKRKEIIDYEISRTNQTKQEKAFASKFLNNLLNNISEFPEEITLLQTYLPITLSFDRLVHICIKHFEETKFGNGLQNKRTYFNYAIKDLMALLKMILKSIEVFLVSHFREVYLIKKRIIEGKERGYRNDSISFNGDIFSLAISSNGNIEKFHQI